MTELADAGHLRNRTDVSPDVRATERRRVVTAVLAYAGVRALGLAVLAVWSATRGTSPHTLLAARWDSLWYTRVAEGWYGYQVRLPEGGVHSDLAFFPLLPALERGFAQLSPLSAPDAGLLVSAVASLATAWALYLVGERLHGPRAGVCLAVLWGAVPVGVVQSMAYSESLFTALAAWALWAALTGRWVWAGTLAALSGLTRPVGAAVVAGVWCAALCELWRRRRGPGARMALGLLLAPAGWFGFVAWVGVRTRSVTGYLDVQGQWGNGFDGGWAFARFVWENLTGTFVGGLALLAGVALVLWLYALCVRQRQPSALLVYAGIVVALALCAKGYFGSKPRLLLPAFPLLLPCAAALSRWRPARAALTLGALAAASAVYGAWWLNGSGPP
ncbi:glycosyltransferase family 39 protein [Streptomyces tubbatahanensis]|uniref:Glycosyltransferase family 39 protein n=1 Tax=Streptomyces tubbatahanensis TaxID=2923272 RepID=A0ABY3XP44_9ACTN|nr:glycosyltransferase family 39 protein [Streptomyces tubbatahanensis]UNS96237.1 glycosyltransferase family 39 protein [Streptomyces tubbatahanensis]